MSKVIFLDFDGPLFPKKSLTYPENIGENSTIKCQALDLHHSVKYWKMDSLCVKIINYLCSFGIPIVVTSSWANPIFHSEEHITNLFIANDIKGKMHIDWNTNFHSGNRIEQISKWLNEHPETQDYVVFDDVFSGKVFLDDNNFSGWSLNKDKIILVDFEEGISANNLSQAKEILKLDTRIH